MMHPRELHIEDYTYPLPDARIARYPLAERDASRLLICNNGHIEEDIYRNIAQHIPGNALMVFNETRVINARLLFKKPSGGVIEVFCLNPGKHYPDINTAMLQKKSVLWECLIGGASKWKRGMALEMKHKKPDFTLTARIAERNPADYILSLEWDADITFAEVLQHAGAVPLPPYLQRNAEPADAERYQTVFAREAGSVAAPTAGLHFTDYILGALADRGIDRAFVTLHVGAGTFKPVKTATLADHAMHEEWMQVTFETLQQLQHHDCRAIAVGTTSLRTLESLYWIGNQLLNGHNPDLQGIAIHQWDPYEGSREFAPAAAIAALMYYMQERSMDRLITRTQILIAPGYHFKIVDTLVTNFHQPQSTLLLLIAAFIGDDWRKVYDYALAHDYRFLSFGDGCLLHSRNSPAASANMIPG